MSQSKLLCLNNYKYLLDKEKEHLKELNLLDEKKRAESKIIKEIEKCKSDIKLYEDKIQYIELQQPMVEEYEMNSELPDEHDQIKQEPEKDPMLANPKEDIKRDNNSQKSFAERQREQSKRESRGRY